MVEFKGPGLSHQKIDNSLIIIPGILISTLIAFIAYKLYNNLCEKQKKRTEKERAKLDKKNQKDKNALKKKL
ncbi:unnamed protein product [Brachionus calyciflorus]|uniref:Small integral membrane protein 15 n=1 Tax=Brachionus calyciflorus TaxID=104777 RepID=A0A813P3L8_9BILA|nr:unnamed protein product [Brachionus calyciflorus]